MFLLFVQCMYTPHKKKPPPQNCSETLWCPAGHIIMVLPQCPHFNYYRKEGGGGVCVGLNWKEVDWSMSLFLEKGRKKSWWSHLSSVSPDMHCHRQSTTKPSMVGNASGYWARRKAESKHLTVGDRQDIVTAYRRTGTVRGAAKQGRVKVDPKTARKVIRQWHHVFFVAKETLPNPLISN